MVDKSDYVVFYSEEREGSGVYKTYRYAKGKRGKVAPEPI